MKKSNFKIASQWDWLARSGGGKLSGKFGFGVFGRSILPPTQNCSAQNAIQKFSF
ncbi:MAG TPA: hypothetical protein P5096_01245 [Patescibacteria group bacterium]|nr:hypothetical protein [Patescibacteria group bacterium]